MGYVLQFYFSTIRRRKVRISCLSVVSLLSKALTKFKCFQNYNGVNSFQGNLKYFYQYYIYKFLYCRIDLAAVKPKDFTLKKRVQMHKQVTI